METVLSASLSAYANYIARLVPGTAVEQRGSDTVLVTTLQYGGYSAILLRQLGISSGYANSLRTPAVVLDRLTILDAPLPGLLRLRPYIETDTSLGYQPRRVRVNVNGDRLGLTDDSVIEASLGAVNDYYNSISVDVGFPSFRTINVSPSPALVFGVATLEDGSGVPLSDSGSRVELRAVASQNPSPRDNGHLEISELQTDFYLPDGTTQLRQRHLDGDNSRPQRKIFRLFTGFLVFDYIGNENATFYYLASTPIAGATYEPVPFFVDQTDYSGYDYANGPPSFQVVAGGDRTGALLPEGTRTALFFGGIYDDPDTSPALYPPGNPPHGVSAAAATAREGHARAGLALEQRLYSDVRLVRRKLGGAFDGSVPVAFGMRLLSSIRPLFAEQLFMDDAPLIYPGDPAGSPTDGDSRRLGRLLSWCSLPELLSEIGNMLHCGDPASWCGGADGCTRY